MKKSLFFGDVENCVLYELKPNKQRGLLKAYPNWYTYEGGDKELYEVYEYFKTHGVVVAAQMVSNLFLGFVH